MMIIIFINNNSNNKKNKNNNDDNNNNWRASEASETLSGVTQSRFRYIYLSVYGVRETSVLARASNYVS